MIPSTAKFQISDSSTVTVQISGAPYTVTKLEADPAVARLAYRLQKGDSSDETTYDVRLDQRGYIYCECLGFLRWQTRCKHIRCLQAAGMLNT